MIKVKNGDILSESTHYLVEDIKNDNVILKHIESGSNVAIQLPYVENLLQSASYITSTVEVCKEDKKDGTLGIRSIWENIHTDQVFTVCFKKQDKPKSATTLKKETDEIIDNFVKLINKTKDQKKGVSEVAKNMIYNLIKNPISLVTEGEDRILCGYKKQFISRDGKYDCIEILEDGNTQIRPVNINTIKWLIFNGVKYIVK